MSDSDKKPKVPPPDDFSKTTPNVNISDDDSSEWDKTSFNVPAETPADDWGKTVINYDVSGDDDDGDDESGFGDSRYSNNSPKEPDWGMTQANIDVNADFETPQDRNIGGGDEEQFGATVPYFKLPEAEREKYQNIPPTPTEKVKQEEKEQREKGGVPLWFWVTSGLMILFSFSILFIFAAWYFLTGTTGFTVVVQNAPHGSRFLVNGSEWGVPSTGNEHKLFNLEAGQKTLQVVHPNFSCMPKDITGKDGDVIPYKPGCESSGSTKIVGNRDCEKTLDETTRESCAEEILDGLSRPPKSPELDRLLRALNLLRINFATGSAEVPLRNRRILKKAAGHIKNLPPIVELEIGGHTDNVGTNENNQKLSDRRAIAVRDLFLSFGVRESRLTNKGYGEEKPTANNSTTEGKARNRRIEYRVTRK